jgi:5-methyltetrahydrofolate--homocysteine methyltransferase
MKMFFKEDWLLAKERYKAWWNKEITDTPIIQVTAPKKDTIERYIWDSWTFIRNLEDISTGVRRFERFCEKTFFGGEAYPNLFINLGPGVMAAYLDATLKYRSDSQTVWFETPKMWKDLQNLKYNAKNKWWNFTKQIALIAGKAAVDRFIVGTTDLGGILDIAASLRGTQNLVVDMYQNPQKIKKLCDLLLNLWIQYYKELHHLINIKNQGSSSWMDIWSPKNWYPIQCDFSALLSPKQFEKFALPQIKEQCKFLDQTIYHWDGPRQIHHLDHLLSISELDGIQWTPGAGQPGVDSTIWFPLYKKIQKKDKLLVLLEVPSEKVKYLLKKLSPKGVLISTSCKTESEAKNLLKKTEKI